MVYPLVGGAGEGLGGVVGKATGLAGAQAAGWKASGAGGAWVAWRERRRERRQSWQGLVRQCREGEPGQMPSIITIQVP